VSGALQGASVAGEAGSADAAPLAGDSILHSAVCVASLCARRARVGVLLAEVAGPVSVACALLRNDGTVTVALLAAVHVVEAVVALVA
jgi:hypothetical protein